MKRVQTWIVTLREKTHRISLPSLAAADDEVRSWLKSAYDRDA